MWHPQQIGEIAAAGAKDALRGATWLLCRRLRSQHLSDVGKDVFTIGRRQPKKEISNAIGEPVSQHPWRQSSDPGEAHGDRDAELIAKLASLFTPESHARSLPQRALTAGAREDRLWRGIVVRE